MRDGASMHPGTLGPVLDLLVDLLDALHRAEISCCYWKSTRRIAPVLAGESDLDLLVDRKHRNQAQRLLLGCGFKFVPSLPSRDDPAMMSFLGYDEPSGRIVHVHVHFRLVLGASLLKVWRPPWEAVILGRAVSHPALPIRVLDPATEALLLLVRSCVEFDAFDPIALRQSRAMSRKFAADRAAFASHLDRATLRERATELFGEDMAEGIADAACSGQAPSRRLGRRVRGRLAAHRVYNAPEARLHTAGRAFACLAGTLNKHVLYAPRPWSRRVLGGGVVVTVLGVDGSGKTTVVAAIREWLGAELDVLPIYFGTGEGRPSLLLLPLKLLVPLAGLVFQRKPAGASHGGMSGKAPGPLYSVLMATWATVLAAEKRLKLKAARRGADRGMVVVTDRYPQNQIPHFNDGPLLPRLRHVPRWLRRFEANAYELANRLPPDLVIKLQASPELIAQREPDMDPAIVRQRTEEVMHLGFAGSRVAVVSAAQPLDHVITAVKREVWNVL